MQTILGSGGIIATELAKSLTEFTTDIRLVSRYPKKVNTTDKILSADLLNREEVSRAVQGSSVVYVTIGFPYSAKTWQKTWPKLMQNVITACKEHNTKLVFFDNIYMYDANHLDGMTEETPINPPSKKGKVRAQLVHMIMDEVQSGTLTALIARCADYYGPGIERNGMLRETIFKNLAKGKKANWMGVINCKHSFTFTRDAGKEWITTIGLEMGVSTKYQLAPKFLVRILGLFMPIMKEMVEMLYQYDRDYVFKSDKFYERFKIAPTPYLEGIREIIKADYSQLGT